MLSKFAAQILDAIIKHGMPGPRDGVLAGVSGGADSVCLVLVLKELGYDVAIAHVNHGLRGIASDQDETFVRELAHRLGMRFFLKRALLVAGNAEAAGREARRTFFSDLIREHGFAKVAVAHTRNDRVETFLLNLLRGSGSEGLISMAAVSENTVRPLIEATQQDIQSYLEERGQSWRTDATNFDVGFARNRLRHVVIPALESEFNPRLVSTLTRTIGILEAEDAWMRSISEQWLDQNSTRERDQVVVRLEGLEKASPGLVRRVLRSALRRAGSELRDVSFDHIEAVRTLLEPGKSGKLVEIPGGLQAVRDFDRLILRPVPQILPDYEYLLEIPGAVHVVEIGKVFRASIVAGRKEVQANETPSRRVFVDGESIGAYVRIRNWKPGDYYRPVGRPAGKVKKLFQQFRIPRNSRTSWPVVIADSTIIWVASFPVSREFAPGGDSQKIVAFEAEQS